MTFIRQKANFFSLYNLNVCELILSVKKIR